MRFTILIITVLSIQIQCFSQVPGFNKRFDYPYSQTRIFKVLVENDTIIALGDGFETDTSTDEGLVLMKFDTLGNLIDSSFIYDSILSTEPVPLRWGSLLSATDGGYIMNATAYLSAYPVIVKTNHDLTLEFVKKYQEPIGYSYHLCDMIPISDGYLLFGLVKKENDLNDGYIRKISLNGDSIWLKNYGNVNTSESINDIEKVNDTTFAVSLVKDVNATSSLSSIIIINQDGVILQTWNSLPDPEIGYLREILSADDEGYLVYGLYPLALLPPFDKLVKSTISRLDKDFNILWSKRYGMEVPLSSEVMFYNFENTIDGNYIGVGSTYIDQPATYPVPTGWLMKFSSAGDSIWSRLDTSDLTPWHVLNYHKLGGVGVLSSGSIVAGGYARHLNDYYAWLIKVTNDGCLDTLYCGLVSGVEELTPQPETNVTVYPNPVNHTLNLGFGQQHEWAIITMFDVHGKLYTLQELEVDSDGYSQISVQGLPTGLYILKVQTDMNKPYFAKLEVLH